MVFNSVFKGLSG